MVTRFELRCRGCGEPFLLRMEIAPSLQTRFALPCPHCDCPLRGVYRGLTLSEVRIEWDDVDLLPPDTLPIDTRIVTAGTITPLDPTAQSLSDFGGAPNATFGRLVGGNASWANGGHARLQQQLESWRAYERLLHYYLSERWDRFDSALADLVDEPLSVLSQPQRRHVLALAPAQALLLPLLGEPHAARMLEPFLQVIQSRHSDPKLIAWAVELERSEALAGMQRLLFEQLQAYVRAWEAWSPGFIVRATEPERRSDLSELRVVRDDFGVLRDLYVQVYETCCRVFWLPIGVMNIDVRGDRGTFGRVPSCLLASNAKAAAPSSLAAYKKLPNANKFAWFGDWPSWQALLPRLLDKGLRNSVGHASARHDLATASILADTCALTYLDFTAAVFDLAYPLLVLLQITKSLRLVAADVTRDQQ